MVKKYLNLKTLILVIIFVVPWVFFGTNEVSAEKITSDLRFYEINTCKISLSAFLLENPNVIYQDHYKIRFNNYSSIKCFGTITGIDQIGHDFYISIGTNSFLNIFFQIILMCTILSFFNYKYKYNISLKDIGSSFLSSALITFSILVEERFYLKSLYFFDYQEINYRISLFIFIFLNTLLLYIFTKGFESKIINTVPYLFLFQNVFGGFNFYLYFLYLVPKGIFRLIFKKKLFIKPLYLFFILLLWVNNSYQKEYFLDPDKIRGFSSSIFSQGSIFVWSLILVFSINGLFSIFQKYSQMLNLEVFKNNFFYSGTLLLLFGFLGSHLPVINFMNYYYFGQNKFGINRTNLFEVNEWGERLAWRGFSPSAETSGEFFAFGILFYLLAIISNKFIFKKIDLLYISIFTIGLLSSNNRAALVSVLFCLLLFLYVKKVFNKKFLNLFFVLCSILFLFLIGFNNLNYPLEYYIESVLSDAKYYALADYSSSLNYLNNLNDNGVINFVFYTFSLFGFLINRSELWGIFFARYNPSLQEFLLGTGLNNLGQLYGEVNIKNTSSFLLPHSSFLDLIVFVGMLNTIFILIIIVLNIKSSLNRGEFIFSILSIFALTNLFKSDSLFYFSSFSLYLLVFYITSDKSSYLERKNKQ